MKIAVTCENEQVFQHFGHTPGFAIFESQAGEIVNEKRISSGDSGHGALATLLAEEKVDLLICGGIGMGAVNALAQANIFIVGGAEGNVKDVVQAFLNGTLLEKEVYHCNQHSGGQSCDGLSCGGHCSH